MNDLLQRLPRNHSLVQRSCPEYDGNKQVCLAATTLMVPDRRQQMQYCATDDYDNCPVYLCKALRSSRGQGLDREPWLDCGK